MFDRLKSLPLTIFLTFLIWMYAEAQFTSVQPDVFVSVQIASGSPDFAVRTLDPETRRYTNVMTFMVTLQGPKNQIDQIYQESQGAARDRPGENLTYVPAPEQLREAADTGQPLHPNVNQMLNRLEYFRSRGVTVTAASPLEVAVEVDSVSRVRRAALFQSSVAVENATVEPAEVEVQIPAGTLRSVGDGKLVVRAVPVNDQQLAALPPDSNQLVPVRFVAEYPGPRDDRIRIIPAQGTATVRLRRALQSVVAVNDVPVWVSGPAPLLAQYDVEVTPGAVSLVLSGSTALVEATRQRLAGGARGAGVFAYLDLVPDDRPEAQGSATRRMIRYIVPNGLTLLQSPPDAAFRLVPKRPVAPPTAAPPATTTQPGAGR